MSSAFMGTTAALAQQGAAPAAAGPSFLVQMAPIVVIFVIIYFLIMRPQQQKQKQHQELLRNLQVGDKVLTQAGIYGTIAKLDEKVVVLQVDEKVRIRMSRAAIADKVTEEIAV